MTDTRTTTLEEPYDRFFDTYKRAAKGPFDHTAMVLATVSPDGHPSARVVLLKEATYQGFAFHTNYESRKGRELTDNPKAALCFYWPEIGEQVRVEGTVSKLPPEDSDTYFQTRPRERQLGAWASRQSEIISDRESFMRRIEELEAQYEGVPIPRPPNWGGYILRPNRIEFWINGEHRLHDRYAFDLLPRGTGWQLNRLSP